MGVIVKNILVKGNRISADVIVNGEINNVWYEFSQNMEKITTRPANAFLVTFMPIAMITGDSIEIDGEISKKLYNNMNTTYQDILLKWHDELSRVKIKAKKISDDIVFSNDRKIISCFTGGVDAFYTLIKNEARIDSLLYVWGFDIPLTESSFFQKVKKHLETCAKSFNKEIVFVKTNLGFEVTNKYASWGDFCFGPAIASVVLLMTQKYNTLLMPSGNDYSVLIPRGGHVLINHLWNCDNTKFIYEGAEASRVEKVDYIADNKIVQNHLRVCYSSHNEYNCSECEKCIRTMSSLEAVNKLKKVKTFNKPLILDNIEKIKLGNDTELKLAEATKNKAIKNNKLKLASELDKQIMNYQATKLVKYINDNFNKLIANKTFNNFINDCVDKYINNNTKYTSKKLFRVVIKKIKNKLIINNNINNM